MLFYFSIFVISTPRFRAFEGAKTGKVEISPTRRNFVHEMCPIRTHFVNSKSRSTRPRFRRSKNRLYGDFFENEMYPTRTHFVLLEIEVYTTSISRITKSPLHEMISMDSFPAILRPKIVESLRNVVFWGRATKMTQKQHIGNFQI